MPAGHRAGNAGAGRGDPAAASLRKELQRGIPLSPRPWAELAARLGLGEEELLERVRAWRKEGALRRVGFALEARALGLASALCAVDPLPEREEGFVRLLRTLPGVTHAYEREGSPRYWFTVAFPPERREEVLSALEASAGAPLLVLPPLRPFKLEVSL